MPSSDAGYAVDELLELIGGRLEGASAGRRLTHLADPRAADYADHAATAVVVLGEGTSQPDPAPGLLVVGEGAAPAGGSPVRAAIVPDARLALARLSRLFDDRPAPAAGRSDAASVDPSATLAADVSLAPGAVIGAGATLGRGCVVGANSVVGAGAVLGEGCVLHPNVTLYPGVTLGNRVVVHSGSVIGADGFGYAAGPRGAEKIHHLGGVVLEDDVEIGANSAIDRGTLLPTRVGARTKIDNHCQIGHNVRIGHDSLIAGMSGVAGSVDIGSGVIIGGYVGISDHVSIGDGARIAGRSGVTKSVPAGATWAGFPAKPQRAFVRELYLLGKLEQIWQAVKPRRGDDRGDG